jgi:hypothetical protein
MTPEEEWEVFLAGHRRWLTRFRWAWTVALVLFAAAVISWLGS